jgi:L-serine dehydratase
MYNSMKEIADRANQTGEPFWKVIQMDDCMEEAISPEESWQKMKRMYEIMRETDRNYDAKAKSSSGLVGTEAGKLEKWCSEGNSLTGSFINMVMIRALRTAESNACMKRIVAAPTAGSCGVIPAVFLTAEEAMKVDDDRMTEALYVSAGIGGVLGQRASLAGASGGCQAEIGSASAMAAGGLTALRGGTPEQISNAAALAMKSMLGLVCDPVAGLVEIPCVKRNVLGAINAVSASEMAMAGIMSKIPVDEVFDAMKSVGQMMNADLRESGIGGLAGTPTGKEIQKRLKK